MGDHFEDANPDVIDGSPGTDLLQDDWTSRFTDLHPDVSVTLGGGADDGRHVYADRRGGDCGPLWCAEPYGNDTVDIRDGEPDSVDCGFGQDVRRGPSPVRTGRQSAAWCRKSPGCAWASPGGASPRRGAGQRWSVTGAPCTVRASAAARSWRGARR